MKKQRGKNGKKDNNRERRNGQRNPNQEDQYQVYEDGLVWPFVFRKTKRERRKNEYPE